MSAQSKLDILLDCILRVYARYVCSLCDHHFVLSYRGMEVVDKKNNWHLICKKCNIHREFIVPQDDAWGLLKKHILAALYRSVPLHKH